LWGAGVLTLLAAIHHGFAEWSARRGELDESGLFSAGVAAAGGGVVVLAAQYLLGYASTDWALGVAACVLMGAMLLRQASLVPGSATAPSVAAGLVMGLSVIAELSQARGASPPPLAGYLAATFGVGAALQFWALKGAREAARDWAEHASALFAAVALFGLVSAPSIGLQGQLTVAVAVPAIAGLIALAATRLDSGRWYLAAVALAALGHNAQVARSNSWVGSEAALLGLIVLSFAAFTWWPIVTSARFRQGRWAWYGSALAGPMWFPAARKIWTEWLGDGAIGALAVGFAAVSVGALVKAQSCWEKDDPIRKSVLAWLGAAALFFISLAIPLQLERSWWTIGWALEGAAVLALWKGLDHAGLKYFAVALFCAVAARLLLNAEVLTYYDRGPWRIVNWIAYTYLVPAGAMLVGASILRPLERPRLRQWEESLYDSPVQLASVLGLFAVLIGFAWINLAVVDWFAEGPALTVSLDRMPARDLSFSIAWAVYAGLLLGVGMARRIAGLRYASLALLLLTIAKVFLYDLGHLKDLYRVASLLGLAVSLFLVSFAYQRFVFKKESKEPPPTDDEEVNP